MNKKQMQTKNRSPELEGMWRNPSILKGDTPDSSGSTNPNHTTTAAEPKLNYYYY